HGRIFDVPVWIAPGWEVEQVSCSEPAERLRNWIVRPAGDAFPRLKGGNLFLAEVQPPLESPAGPGDGPPFLSLRLRGKGWKAGSAPLPIVLPGDASTVEGMLGIDWEQ